MRTKEVIQGEEVLGNLGRPQKFLVWRKSFPMSGSLDFGGFHWGHVLLSQIYMG